MAPTLVLGCAMLGDAKQLRCFVHGSHRQARRLFDETAADYQVCSQARIHSFRSLIFQRRIEIVASMLRRLPPTGAILDFGMGPAVFGRLSVDLGWRYVGVDISPEMVRHARALGLRQAEFHVGDLDFLEGCKERFEVALAIGLVDYLETPEHGIERLADSVKPGGWLILSFRNRWSLPRILRDAAKYCLRRAPLNSDRRAFFSAVHEHSFDFRSQLHPHLRRCGFGEFEVRYFNCSPFFFNFPMPATLWRLWRSVDAVLCALPLRGMCSGGVVCARRTGGSR